MSAINSGIQACAYHFELWVGVPFPRRLLVDSTPLVGCGQQRRMSEEAVGTLIANLVQPAGPHLRCRERKNQVQAQTLNQSCDHSVVMVQAAVQAWHSIRVECNCIPSRPATEAPGAPALGSGHHLQKYCSSVQPWQQHQAGPRSAAVSLTWTVRGHICICAQTCCMRACGPHPLLWLNAQYGEWLCLHCTQGCCLTQRQCTQLCSNRL